MNRRFWQPGGNGSIGEVGGLKKRQADRLREKRRKVLKGTNGWSGGAFKAAENEIRVGRSGC